MLYNILAAYFMPHGRFIEKRAYVARGIFMPVAILCRNKFYNIEQVANVLSTQLRLALKLM